MLNAAYSPDAIKNAGNYMSSRKRTVTKVKRGRVKGARVTVGHVPYSVYHEHLPADTLYVTFLREPIDRVLSHYYRHLLARTSARPSATSTASRPARTSRERERVRSRRRSPSCAWSRSAT